MKENKASIEDWYEKIENIIVKKRTEGKEYGWFCDVVLSVVVGKMFWKNFQAKKLVVEMASTSDEAFGILLLQNYIKPWVAQAAKKAAEDEENEDNEDSSTSEEEVPVPLYTVRKSGGGKDNGWLGAGIKRYNKLLEEVREDREWAIFDQDYKEKKEKMEEERDRTKKRKAQAQEPSEEEVQVIDAWSI